MQNILQSEHCKGLVWLISARAFTRFQNIVQCECSLRPWLVGINTTLTLTLGKQVNIHPLGGNIHPVGNSIQDIYHGMNMPSSGMNIHFIGISHYQS